MDSVHHLKMMHRGSILHNSLSFAALVLIFVLFFLFRGAKHGEIVGEMEEEEPEGEVVVGPSGEATVHSSGKTPPVPLILIVINLCAHIIYFNTSLLHILLLGFPHFFSWLMSPLMRRCPHPKPRRRRILTFCIVGCKWGFPAYLEEETLGICWRWVHSLVSFCFPVHMVFYSPLFSYPCILFYLSGPEPVEEG